MSEKKRALAVRLLCLLVAYGGLVAYLTWPLAADLDRALPCTDPACRFDTLYSAWVLAWQSHALATEPARFADANIYFPAPDALYYGPAGFGALPYFMPTFLATGNAAIATNVMLLLGAALSALSMHWVVARWTGRESAGVVAAVTLLASRWYLWGFIAATPHLAPIQYFPLIAWLAASPVLGWRAACVLLALIVAQSAIDPVYVAPAVMAPLALLAATRIARPHLRRAGLVLAAVLALALVCLAIPLAGYLRVRAQNPLLAEQTPWRGGMLLTDLTSLLWRYSAPTTVAPAAAVVIVVGGVCALARRRRLSLPHDAGWRQGALWAVVGVAISITPVALWGETRVYLPQHLLALATPLYEIIRVPRRLGIAATIGIAILAGVAFAELTRLLDRLPAVRRPAYAVRATAATLVVIAILGIPPAGTRPLPPGYLLRATPTVPATLLREIVARPGPHLQLPVLDEREGGLPSPERNAAAMFRSTFHWQPLLNGYSSYWPSGFVERMRLAGELPRRRALLSLVRETGLRTVWVDTASLDARERARWSDARSGLVPGLVPLAEDRGQLLFAVDPLALGIAAAPARDARARYRRSMERGTAHP